MRNPIMSMVAREVRARLRRKIPHCRFSLRIRNFPGGSELKVALMSAPASPFASLVDAYGNRHTGEYAQLNTMVLLRRDKWPMCNGYFLTDAGWQIMQKAAEIANARKYRDSEPESTERWAMYYLSVQIGRFNRPFLVKAPKTEAPTLASVETNHRKSAGKNNAIQHSQEAERAK